jgi:hypothetical protein
VQDERYAPPKAEVEVASLDAAAAPALWNPNAAANWSLLLSPIFGTWLHMLNWRALGETERAESAKTWLMVSTLLQAGVSIGGALLPFSGLERLRAPVSFVLLIAWYFASARSQAKWVTEHYGDDYPRRGWTPPLLGALVLWIASALAFLLMAGIGMSLMPS